MHPFFPYLIQVNIALALFYILYVCVLKRDTFLRLKRFFFLSAIVFSLLYPLFVIPALSEAWTFPRAEVGEETGVATVIVGKPTLSIVDEETTGSPASISWISLFSLLYLAVTLVFASRFLFQLGSIYRMHAKSEKQTISGTMVYQLNENITPFSFFNLIFIHAEQHSSMELNQILLHEQTHAKQGHSVDIVLIELLCVFFWWNPFAWWIKREMSMNLEYLADNGVLREGVDTREYQYHLLRLTYHESAVPIVNNFNVSRLKQRIMMMNKTKSPAFRLAKYFLILPLVLFLMTGNSVYAQQVDNVLMTADKEPQFPGGEREMMKFLAGNVRYPVLAQENHEQGRVVVNFIIEKDGSVSGIAIAQGATTRLDAEAVRVLTAMPKWTPAEHDGEAARFRYTMPFVFRLQGDNIPASTTPASKHPKTSETGKLLDEVVIVGYGSSGGDKQAASTGKQQTEELFVVVEEQPEYPGGAEAMLEFLKENILYPAEAKEKGTQGRVICNFIVMKDGTISDVSVVRGVDPLLDAEAVRVIESMPRWKPGKQRGQEVNVRYTLPVIFRFNKDEPTNDAPLPLG